MPTLDVAINALRAKHGAKQFDDAVKRVQSGAKKTDKDIKKVDKSVNTLGRTLTQAAKAAAGFFVAHRGARFLRESLREFAQFETQLANVSTMLDEQTMSYLPQYKQELSRLSVQYGESTSTLSQGLYDILSASVDAGDAIEVLQVATEAARAGLTDTAVAADVLTTIINAYGREADDAAEISDILFATVKRGKTTFNELASSMGMVVSLAATAGLSIEEVSAALATMTRAGIGTDIAVTSLRGILTTFLSPTKENITAAKELGLELNSNTLRTIGLTGAVQQLEGATAEQISAIFSNVRALAGLSALVEQTEGFIYDLGEVTQSAGKRLEAFGKIADTTTFKLDQMSEAWKEVKRTVGEEIAPSIDSLITAMQVLGKVVSGTANFIGTDLPNALKKGHSTLELFRHKILQVAAKIDLTGLLPEDAIARDIEEIQTILDHLNGVHTSQQKLAEGTMKYVEMMRRAKVEAAEFDKIMKPLATLDFGALGLESVTSTRTEMEQLAEEMRSAEAPAIIDESKFEAAKDQFDQLKEKIAEVKIEIEDFGKTDIEKQISQFERMNGTFRFAGDVKEYENAIQELRKELTKLSELEEQRAMKREKIESGKAVTEAWREIQNEKKLLGLTNEERERAIRLTEMEAHAKVLLGENAQELVDLYMQELVELSKQRQIMELVGQVRSGVGDLIRAPLTALLDETKDLGDVLEDELRNIGQNILRTLYEQTITQPLQDVLMKSITGMIDPLTNALSGVLSGLMSGLGSGIGSAIGGLGTLFAEKGTVLEKGRVRGFSDGTIVTKPTLFPMANGGVGVMSEKKPEAIMPLDTDAQGRLGVHAAGQQAQSLKVVNVLDGSVFEEYLSSAPGERMVLNIMRRNKSELESEAL
jgi:TP901 family phage tail tape measure protein